MKAAGFGICAGMLGSIPGKTCSTLETARVTCGRKRATFGSNFVTTGNTLPAMAGSSFAPSAANKGKAPTGLPSRSYTI